MSVEEWIQNHCQDKDRAREAVYICLNRQIPMHATMIQAVMRELWRKQRAKG